MTCNTVVSFINKSKDSLISKVYLNLRHVRSLPHFGRVLTGARATVLTKQEGSESGGVRTECGKSSSCGNRLLRTVTRLEL